MPISDQLTNHARRRAQQRAVTLDEIEAAYVSEDWEPGGWDDTVIRTVHLQNGGSVSVVVASDNYTIVSVWRNRAIGERHAT